MADEVDVANQLAEQNLQASINAHLAKPRMAWTGFCHNEICAEPVDAPLLFCCVDCRDYYEKMERRRAAH